MEQPRPQLQEPPHHAGGYCTLCQTSHFLGMGESRKSAEKLMALLDSRKSIDLFSENRETDPALSTAPLWGEPRGKMFGVMDCITEAGNPVTLYAFSGQYHGRWRVKGWVPPLFDVDRFHELTCDTEKRIKKLGREIEALPERSEKWFELRKIRRSRSRLLMQEIHALYRLSNFRGETRVLSDAFYGSVRIPTGTGDCCGPKLLNYAAVNRLTPTGMCEFFYGRKTKSGSHDHARFSSSCAEKCEPILGFMLCGLNSSPDCRS